MNIQPKWPIRSQLTCFIQILPSRLHDLILSKESSWKTIQFTIAKVFCRLILFQASVGKPSQCTPCVKASNRTEWEARIDWNKRPWGQGAKEKKREGASRWCALGEQLQFLGTNDGIVAPAAAAAASRVRLCSLSLVIVFLATWCFFGELRCGLGIIKPIDAV